MLGDEKKVKLKGRMISDEMALRIDEDIENSKRGEASTRILKDSGPLDDEIYNPNDLAIELPKTKQEEFNKWSNVVTIVMLVGILAFVAYMIYVCFK